MAEVAGVSSDCTVVSFLLMTNVSKRDKWKRNTFLLYQLILETTFSRLANDSNLIYSSSLPKSRYFSIGSEEYQFQSIFLALLSQVIG